MSSDAIHPQDLGIKTLSEHRGNYKIHLAGIEPGVLLAALWNNARPEPGGRVDPMTGAEGQQIIDAHTQLMTRGTHVAPYATDLAVVHGRQTQVEYWGEHVHISGYDHINGAGLLFRIVQQVRDTGSVNRLS